MKLVIIIKNQQKFEKKGLTLGSGVFDIFNLHILIHLSSLEDANNSISSQDSSPVIKVSCLKMIVSDKKWWLYKYKKIKNKRGTCEYIVQTWNYHTWILPMIQKMPYNHWLM